MMLLTLLISRKMILRGNLSFAQVVSGGYEGCIVCLVDALGVGAEYGPDTNQ
jgi:hypothetical protein